MGKVVVFGSINIDLVTMVEEMPKPGETIIGRSFEILPGGKGANQALAARRSGAQTVMIGAVGTDVFAAPAVENLAAAGVDLSFVEKVEGPSGIAAITVDGSGENVIAIVAGANASLDAERGRSIKFEPGDILLLQMEVPTKGALAAIKAAREQGARVIFNAAPMIPDVMKLVSLVDLLIVNETELASICDLAGLAGDDDEEKTHAVAGHFDISVITTRGGDGIFAVNGSTQISAGAYKVEVIDTVGAGDTVCGSLAAQLASGQELSKDVLSRAAIAGSLACTKSGAQESIPERSQVLEIYETLSGK